MTFGVLVYIDCRSRDTCLCFDELPTILKIRLIFILVRKLPIGPSRYVIIYTHDLTRRGWSDSLCVAAFFFHSLLNVCHRKGLTGKGSIHLKLSWHHSNDLSLC